MKSNNQNVHVVNPNLATNETSNDGAENKSVDSAVSAKGNKPVYPDYDMANVIENMKHLRKSAHYLAELEILENLEVLIKNTIDKLHEAGEDTSEFEDARREIKSLYMAYLFVTFLRPL